jgi:outer membrane protein TolC
MKRFLILIALAGCAIHPEGEDEERARAEQAGTPFIKPFEERALPVLSKDADWKSILRYAFLANAELEQRYWEWRAAIEKIPQEASPKTTAAVSFGAMFDNGVTSWDRQTIGLSNDPMANIPWPGRLATAGRRALEMARATGFRFERAKFELQARALSAYYDFALQAELIRLQDSNAALLETIAELTEARARAGGPQQDLLKARTERDLARNQLDTLKAELPTRRAALNAIMSREPNAELEPPSKLPEPRTLAYKDQELLDLTAERNPELRALAHEIRARKDGIRLAEQEYIPEFGLSAATSLDGMIQNLMAMVTAPFLRFEAIRGMIEEAKAELYAARSMRRQTENDLKARILSTLYLLRNAERQVTFFRDTIVPRAEEVVTRARASYTAGQIPLVELLDSQRMLIDVRVMLSQMRIEREKLLAEAESLAAVDIERR